jgi:hypothetical protein
LTACDTILQGLKFLVGSSSFQNAAAVTPHNTNDLANTASALWIGTTGNVTVDLETTGENITFNAVPVGLFKVRVTRVYAAGTSASNIVALW